MNKEKVLIIKRKNLPNSWLQSKLSLPLPFAEIDNFSKFIEWTHRASAETNQTLKQIIPYIILKNTIDDTIAVYARAGTEKRLHGLFSIGIGGHINPVDFQNDEFLSKIVLRAAEREFSEELITKKDRHNFKFKGIINEEITQVGKVHIGFVFEILLGYKPEPQQELKNMSWTKTENLVEYNLELWSELALNLII